MSLSVLTTKMSATIYLRHAGTLLLTVALLQCGITHAQVPQHEVPAPLDFNSHLLPIPDTSAFHDPGYFVWCGALVRSDDGKYHLFYSRWPEKNGTHGWVTSSEVAHAVGQTPFGPFHFVGVALAPRSKKFWDGMVTHNPTVLHLGKTYYMYYTGNDGDGLIEDKTNFVHRNNQRIGVATSNSPYGPWKRMDHPLLDVTHDRNALDSVLVTNPTVARGAHGKFVLLYKAVSQKSPLPQGGPVVILSATADSPLGPFIKKHKTLFTLPGSPFPFEDPFLWYDASRAKYFAIMKDNQGVISGLHHSSLILFESADAEKWKPSQYPLVSDLILHWKDKPAQHVSRMERPFIFFDLQQKPVALVVAISDGSATDYNVRIPIAP
jgi:hypothetical protein